MKTLLICPAQRPAVEALGTTAPLANLALFGTSLIGHWLEHLAGAGATEARVLASDRVEEIRREVGDGARWGLQVEVTTTSRELDKEEARDRFRPEEERDWLESPNEIVVADRLPGARDGSLFQSYADYYHGVRNGLPGMAAHGRVGLHEIHPGIWVGLRSQVAPGAILEKCPCWIGDHVRIEKEAHIGPNSILEDRAWVGAGAEICESLVGAETRLGAATCLTDSFALGDTLINWRRNSVAKITDPFLLCSLRPSPVRRLAAELIGRLAARRPEPGMEALSGKSLNLGGVLLR